VAGAGGSRGECDREALMFDDDFEDEPTSPYSERARVLVADDDETLRELIVERLAREGFEIVEAGSGFEALGLIVLSTRGEGLDLIVMDNRMPGMSGIELARMLRYAELAVPIVLITAFPDHDTIVEANALGVELMPKPFSMDRLSATSLSVLLGAFT
jgi:CheY-like chemotaxis protein